jgi:ribosome-associated protein
VAFEDLLISSAIRLPAHYFEWSAVRSSGPGGQNVNKVSSKVVLHFDFEACTELAPDVRARLRRIAANRLDAEGRITVSSQDERDQPRNLERARERIRALVVAALERPKPRRPTRPTAGSKRRRLSDKRHQGEKKARRTTSDD